MNARPTDRLAPVRNSERLGLAGYRLDSE